MEINELKCSWEKIKEELTKSLPESVHPWVFSLEFSGYDNGVLTVVTGQAMARDWLRKNHMTQMNSILNRCLNSDGNVFNIIYDTNEAKKLKKEIEKIHRKEAELQQKELAMENLSYMQSASNLNLKYKFENFVVGKSNKFAHDACMAVAKNPAVKYNPLFIYGGSGLGKTHLMQAIGHYTIFNNPKLKVKYTKTDDYINDFISNSRKSDKSIENMSKFYKKYTNVDIILLDDIQFIESKEKTMEKLQQTFDTLKDRGKQIVITSDRIPKEIPKLTKALCTRFEMGLMVELLPPDYDVRYEIVKRLANDNGIEYEEAVLKYIATHYSNNIRELEGAFTRVCAYAEMNNSKLTLSLAKEILKCGDAEELTFEKITDVTSKYYEIDVNDIRGTARSQKVAIARQTAIYLSRELTNQSFENIGIYFNKKHSTALYAYEQVAKRIKTDSELNSAVREIKQVLKVI